MEIEMIVEIPGGSRNKYEMDHKLGRIRLDRMLFTATRYPHDYGYIPDTCAEDGDPLDAMVLLDEPTFPGCQITVRSIGVFWMLDEKGPDHSKCFKIAAQVGANRFEAAWGRNKKEAEQRAARNALCEIHGKPAPYPSDGA